MVTDHSEGTTTPERGKAGRYHHGDLRRALLDAALDLAAAHGIGAFTLREVARQAGVSHNAPYHHFADKAALVEALAAEGFDALTAALRATARATPGGSLDKLRAMGETYVGFALAHRPLYRFMFWPELRHPLAEDAPVVEAEMPRRFLLWSQNAAVDAAAGTAYGVLSEAIAACQEDGLIAPGDPAPLALTVWATVHGLAVLLIETPEGAARGGEPGAHLAAIVTETLIRGLATR